MRTLISPFARLFLKELIKHSKSGKDLETAVKRAAGKIVDTMVNMGEEPDLEFFKKSFGWFQLGKGMDQSRIKHFDEGWKKRVKYWHRKVEKSLGESYSWKRFLENNRLISLANSRERDYD